MKLNQRAKWYGVISAWVFLAASTYLHVIYIFDDTTLPGLLVMVALVSAFFTLIFGLLSLPRWQSFFSLAIFGYALYWFSQPAYGIS